LTSYRWIYHPRNFWAAFPLLFALISNYDEVEIDYITWGLGLPIFFIGLAIRIWAQQHLRYRMGIHKVFTTTGPYSLVRNPMYLGNTLTYVGATICSELLWFAPITFVWAIFFYGFVIRHEENELLKKYGSPYRTYLTQVSRWVPRVRGFSGLTLVNEYLGRAVWAELPCLLILLPYLVKEFLD
jgi:protein-S-isoprenylcysteine O-methyltransferase Ste14